MAKLPKAKAVRKAYRHDAQMPLFTPDCDWKAPEQADWIDFRDCDFLGLDTETHDPNLNEQGPGFIRGESFVTGFSLADENGRKIYLPIGHSEGNVDKDKAIEYLKAQLKRPGLIKVGANVMYDLEALWSLGVEVPGELRDIQVAEPLLDEDRKGGYSLDVLARDYLGLQKNEKLLKEAGAAYGGEKVNPKTLGAIMPAKYWGAYGEDDADLPVHIYIRQMERIQDEELQGIFDLETDLTRVLFKMRMRGVAVDLDAAEQLAKQTLAEEQELEYWMRKNAGWDFNPYSSKDVAAVLEPRGFHVPRTAAGNPSVTNEWLQEIGDVDSDTKQPSGDGDELGAKLYELRRINKMRKDFIEGAILERNVAGRLHPTWHQLREYDEEGKRTRGTRSGRIAASKPNLTQIPARDPVWGPRVRRLFIADCGKRWVKFDYSQQEPRFLLHFAYLMDSLPRHKGGKPMDGAAEAVRLWIENPGRDYHQMVADLVLERSGRDIGRRNAKNINLGGAYGMGVPKLLKQLKVPKEVGMAIMKAYHEGVPYVKLMSASCMERAQEKGFIRTILGRKRRFTKWERKKDWDKEWQESWSWTFDSYEEAIAEFGEGNVCRAGVHKALNALVQGSAGDQMKKTLVMLDEAGYDPQIQVYDEINLSLGSDEEIFGVRHIMQTSIPLKVPHLVEPEVGTSWGQLEDWNG